MAAVNSRVENQSLLKIIYTLPHRSDEDGMIVFRDSQYGTLQVAAPDYIQGLNITTKPNM